MMSYLNDVEVNGAKIDDKTQVWLTTASVSVSFFSFKPKYIINKLDHENHTLLNELQHFKFLNKNSKSQANVPKANVVSSSLKKRKKMKEKNKGSEKKDKASKKKCFHFDEEVYWIRNRTKFF